MDENEDHDHILYSSFNQDASCFVTETEKGFRIYNILKDIAKELDIEDLEQIAYSWLLKHPANIVPILGSGNIEHIKIAVKSLKINMSIEDWFRIYVASKGESLP